MGTPLSHTEPIPEELIGLFNSIHQFSTSGDFAIWVTNGKFNHQIYENKVEEGKYKRTYHYDWNGHIFFQGKAELDLSPFPTETIKALTSKSLVSITSPLFNKVGKKNLSQVFVDPYYTVISHGLYKTNVIGMVWEIYNLRHLLTLYKLRTKHH